MKAIFHRRLTLPVLAAVATSAIVAAVGLAGQGGAPPLPAASGQAAGQLTLGVGEKPIPILSYSWGASNPTTIATGGGGIGSGKVSISSFNFMKLVDANSADLFTAVAKGTRYPKVTFTSQWGTGSATATWVLDFDNVVVESIQHSAGSSTSPSESVSIAFEKIKWTYTDATVTKSGSWNLTTNTP
jgi:type VI secretion system secreted protein Hcp